MAKDEEIEYVNKEGKRVDGRKVDDLRKIKIEASVLKRAEGSCYLEWGQNKILVGVFGPKEALPQHIQDPTKALIDFTYRMATFSVPERKNPRPGRRDMEISKVCGEALEKAVLVNRFPNTKIDIYAAVLDSNAGTRVAALTAASVALADAGIPMRDLVSSVAVGRAGGEIILDLRKEEEDAPDAIDMALAITPNTEEIVLLQMDGLASKEDYDKMIELGIKGCKQVYEMQKEALKVKYSNGAESEAKGDKEEKVDEAAFMEEKAKAEMKEETKEVKGDQ